MESYEEYIGDYYGDDICANNHPLIKLLYHINCINDEVSKGSEAETLFEHFKKCEEFFAEFIEVYEPEISVEVVENILLTTKSLAYQTLGMHEKAKEILDKIGNVQFTSKKDKSTLLGCKSICNYKNPYCDNRIWEKSIREAIIENPKCHLWYFLLGLNLRFQRRTSSQICKPEKEEIDMFLKAYDLRKDQKYESHLAGLYRENNEKEKALNLLLKIFDDGPESYMILLKTALGFMKLNHLEKAKICLDKFGEKFPNHSMYLHYCGNYYIKTKEYDKSLEYLEKAMKSLNIIAERQYLECKMNTDLNFDVVSFMLKMMDRYDDVQFHRKLQPIMLDLGFYFWKVENDMSKALDFFYRAVEINPDCKFVTKYFSPFFKFDLPKSPNVLQLLNKELLPRINFRRSKFTKEEIDKVDKLQIQCDNYFAKELRKTQDSFQEEC